jgi:hypothetical protein
MTAAGDWDEHDGQEPDDDWDDDPRDDCEPDPEDYEINREYEEYAEHCDTAHGGGECDCRPSLAERLAWRAQDAARWLRGVRCRLTVATWEPRTLRIGPAVEPNHEPGISLLDHQSEKDNPASPAAFCAGFRLALVLQVKPMNWRDFDA